MKKSRKEIEEEQQPCGKQTTLEDFFIPQKISAFCNAYLPVQNQTVQTEVFTEARLREFFKAYVIPALGDPLQLYTDALAQKGFKMSVSITGETAIFAEMNI